jgi:hypothetical protein
MTLVTSTTVRLSAIETLAELRERGYTLSLTTRVQEVVVKVGVLYLTVAGPLKVSGPEAPPEYLREAMHRYGPELKAAVAVSNPPVEWIRELVRRYQTGDAHTAMRDGQETRFPVTHDVLCANVASFLDLDPVEDVETIRDIVAKELHC